MPANIDVFWSFRSPYSYLITPDLLRLRADFDVTVTLRPVMPIAIRDKASVFDANDKKRPRYIVMDSLRRAELLGLPMTWPKPDPIVQDRETFEVSEDQPRIWRLTGLGVEAERRGKGIDFACAASAVIWGGTRNWDKGDHLANAAAEVGLDLADMEAAIQPEEIKAKVEDHHAQLEAAGHWGVPTMVFEGEPFFGQDRVDTLRWRLEQKGVPARTK
ncbi:DsbA family protein [Pyruvatibacter sp.]|uniref:2-hydroxychromene-2-carboxylate isomerase n=1 Tax=Pyruvatibacter sp. TaxID=1981328 RepID=UPI00326467FB